MKKVKKSSGLHLWNDHSGMVQVEDMKENSLFIILSEEHCPMTYHREIKRLLPTEVR